MYKYLRISFNLLEMYKLYPIGTIQLDIGMGEFPGMERTARFCINGLCLLVKWL